MVEREKYQEREFDFLRFPETTMENGGEDECVYTRREPSHARQNSECCPRSFSRKKKKNPSISSGNKITKTPKWKYVWRGRRFWFLIRKILQPSFGKISLLSRHQSGKNSRLKLNFVCNPAATTGRGRDLSKEKVAAPLLISLPSGCISHHKRVERI